jgi:ABC-type transport system substrate-binding protein
MKKTILMIFTIAMLALMCTTIVPAHSFCIPPNPAHEDYHFEVYGPHIKGIQIMVFAGAAAEWMAMGGGTLDLEDWPLTPAQIVAWSTPSGPFTVQSYGGEAGYYLIDLNNDPASVCSLLPMRMAIWCLVNYNWIPVNAVPIFTPVPPYMGGWINGGVVPPGGFAGNPAMAVAILTGAGLLPWARPPLFFIARDGDRNAFAVALNAALNGIGIPTAFSANTPRGACQGPVFTVPWNTFDLYTGAWTNIGPDPDYLYDLYHSSMYYAGNPPNYDHINNGPLDADLVALKTAPNMAAAVAACMRAQADFAACCAAIPLWSYTGVKAYKNLPVQTAPGAVDPVGPDPTGLWKHFVNRMDIGVNSWWSTLDAQVYGNLYPNLNMMYGFSSTCQIFNVVYSQWYWDWEVLGRIYDTGYARDPYTLLWTVPQLYQNYSVGLWTDYFGNVKSEVTITLRPDVMWQDGVPLTIADVIYTLGSGPGSISFDLLAKGFPPPWWYPIVQHMQSVYQIDNYNVQILLDVQGIWAVDWVIGSVIIPKHIWKPIVDQSTIANPLVTGSQPDPDIIGTGPFIWQSGTGVGGAPVLLIANAPGTVVNHAAPGRVYTSPGYYQYCPIQVEISDLVSRIIVPHKVGGNWVTWQLVPVTILLKNLWLDGNLMVNKYVYWGTNRTLVVNEDPSTRLPGYPINVILPPVAFPIPNAPPATPYPNGYSHIEQLTFNMTVDKTYYLKVAVHVKGPPYLNYVEPYGGVYENTTLTNVTYTIPNPWISQWINVTIQMQATILEDIGGSDVYTCLGYDQLASWGTWVPTHVPIYNASGTLLRYDNLQNDLKNEAPSCDGLVSGDDVILAARAFGSIPGDTRWNSVADITGDYYVSGDDIILMAKMFGWPPRPPYG